MKEFVDFNWQLFKLLGLVSANTMLIIVLSAILIGLVRYLFGGDRHAR